MEPDNLDSSTRSHHLRSGFDVAIAEECQVYDECHRHLAAYGDRVYEIE